MVSRWIGWLGEGSVSVGAVCGWCREDYLNGRLHEDVGGIVDSLGAQLQDRRIAPLFGLVHILVDLLNKESNSRCTERYNI